jgi:tRNA A37 threonylcarbamoyladenosine biosynthesis protein TsaE
VIKTVLEGLSVFFTGIKFQFFVVFIKFLFLKNFILLKKKGVAGTGKSTILKKIISILDRSTTFVTAPTGKILFFIFYKYFKYF